MQMKEATNEGEERPWWKRDTRISEGEKDSRGILKDS
jgi:hypothetical protein